MEEQGIQWILCFMPGIKTEIKRRSFVCMKYDVIIVGAGPGNLLCV